MTLLANLFTFTVILRYSNDHLSSKDRNLQDDELLIQVMGFIIAHQIFDSIDAQIIEVNLPIMTIVLWCSGDCECSVMHYGKQCISCSTCNDEECVSIFNKNFDPNELECDWKKFSFPAKLMYRIVHKIII